MGTEFWVLTFFFVIIPLISAHAPVTKILVKEFGEIVAEIISTIFQGDK